MSVGFEEVEFKLDCVQTLGVRKGKYDKYNIPVALDDETKARIEELVEKHEAKSPIYVNKENGRSVLYLKLKKLTEKQNRELNRKGKCFIKIHFKLTSTYEDYESGVNYLVFKVIGIAKVDPPDTYDEDEDSDYAHDEF